MKLIYPIAFLVSVVTSLEVSQNLKRDDDFNACTPCIDAALIAVKKCGQASEDETLQCICDLDMDYYEKLYKCSKECDNETVNDDVDSPQDLKKAFCKANDLQGGSSSATKTSATKTSSSTTGSSSTTLKAQSTGSATSTRAREASATTTSGKNSAAGLGAGSLLYVIALALV